jgi:hypothetical protein
MENHGRRVRRIRVPWRAEATRSKREILVSGQRVEPSESDFGPQKLGEVISEISMERTRKISL